MTQEPMWKLSESNQLIELIKNIKISHAKELQPYMDRLYEMSAREVSCGYFVTGADEDGNLTTREVNPFKPEEKQ